MRFIRHATFVFEAGGVRVLVDPMLGPAGSARPVANTPNQRRNPLVDLPFGEGKLAALLQEIDAALVTHTHADHWDPSAEGLIPEDPRSFASRRMRRRSGPQVFGRSCR